MLCLRSGAACTSFRSQKRTGRRPKVKALGPEASVHVWEVVIPNRQSIPDQVVPQTPAQQTPDKDAFSESSDLCSLYTTSTPSSPHFHEPDQPEELFQTTPDLINKFTEIYELFMLGPSFGAGFRAAIQQSYISWPDLLVDAYQAIYTVVTRCPECPRLWEEGDVAMGTLSLQKLRTAWITGTDDALAVAALGQTLAAFDMLTNCKGPLLILRYALSSIQPWYAQLSRDPSVDPVTITPIFWDTVCCLAQREVPVIKFLPRVTPVVDRMAGLCTTLLPIFYDVCVAGKKLKEQIHSGGSIDADTYALKQLEQKLVLWTAEQPQGFVNDFSEDEIRRMQDQAAMYRTVGLLIVHRLLHPIGTLDDFAGIYAEDIMLHLSNCSGPHNTPVAQLLQHVRFPVLVAALELGTLPEHVGASSVVPGKAPLVLSMMLDVVEYVAERRRTGYTGYLFDLLDERPDNVVLP